MDTIPRFKSVLKNDHACGGGLIAINDYRRINLYFCWFLKHMVGFLPVEIILLANVEDWAITGASQ